MTWALAFAGFFVDVIVWIVTGFLHWDFSLSLTFFPFFFAVVSYAWIRRELRRGRRTVIGREELRLRRISGGLVAWTLIAWTANGILMDMPGSVRMFTLMSPLTIFVAQYVVWTFDVSWADVRRILRVGIWALVLDGAVSIATFVLFNVWRILPTQLFFFNDRYPVILFIVGGQSWVRTPGIFENGGTNGLYLLLFLALTACLLLFGSPRRRTMLWAAVAVLVTLVPLTLARRSILSLGVFVLLLGVSVALRRRRFGLLVAIAAVSVVAGLWFLRAVPDITSSQSLADRFRVWNENLFALYPSNPGHLLVGFGVTQSAFRYLPASRFVFVDNLFLALVLFGGIPYLFGFLAYCAVLLDVNIRAARRGKPYEWLALSGAFCLIVMLVNGQFEGFVFNLPEAFPYLTGLSILTRVVICWSRAAPTPGPARPAVTT